VQKNKNFGVKNGLKKSKNFGVKKKKKKLGCKKIDVKKYPL